MNSRLAPSPQLGQRMALVNLVTAGVALLMASSVLIFFQFISLRDALLDDVSVQARIVGDNSTAALAFGDKGASEETLSALAGAPNVLLAGVFTSARVPLAMYRRPGVSSDLPAPPVEVIAAGHHFGVNHLDVVRRIELDGDQIGFVLIRASMERLYARLVGYAGLTLAVALGSLAVAFLLVARMRRAVRSAEAHLDYLAHTDSVTALPNRNAFNRLLSFALYRVDKFGGSVGLLLLDLDNFKVVNDTLGHHNGDKLLALVARRLAEALRKDDTICRIGGDEFAVILESKGAATEGESIADKILATLMAPFAVDDHEIHVTASVGISVYPRDAADLATLTRNADTAMYQAKNKGKNAFATFHPEMDERAQKRLSIESNLRKALERNELMLYYQPQVHLQSGSIVGVEALLRWNHPELGLVSPVDFIPVAEESGLIVSIGRWMLYTACQQAATWRDAGLGTINMSVNLSVRQTKEAGLIGDILAALRHAGLSPSQLELEITETVLMENVHENVELLHRLQTEGIRLSIDDFGTGYSSMAYLKRFPIDQLKIDRTFVRDIPGDGDDEAITTAIIVMAHSLGLSAVAEGVETEAQLQFLRAAGCDIMQGFYYSKPLPPAETTTFLREWSAKNA